MKKITLGGGCFWCTEAVFQRLKGVSSVVSGYMGGKTDNPTYREICTGTTGHAEVIQITYDENIISLEQLLEVFWATHNPTTLNRQGNDSGTQYRSAIFYENDEDLAIANNSIVNIAPKIWDDQIVTEVTQASKFYPAEDKHQNYYNGNKIIPYCRIIISPKVDKLQTTYKHLLKEEL